MKRILSDRAVRITAISALLLIAMTIIGGSALPWAFLAVWVVWVVLMVTAVTIAARRHA